MQSRCVFLHARFISHVVLNMHAYKNKIDDVSKDSTEIQILKWFLAQIVGPTEKLFSHIKIIAARPPKLDPMLIYTDDYFSGTKLPRLYYVSYHVCGA